MEFSDVDFGFAEATTERLDQIALERAGVMGSIGSGYACRGEIKARSDGWSAAWVNTGGMGNCGTLVLIPNSGRTRKIRRQGTIRHWMELGLSEGQANTLYHLRVRYKYELAGVLAQVIRDPAKVQAYLAHPGSYGPGSGRTAWVAHWGDVVSDGEEESLSAPREAALARMVQAVV